ncbi:ferritin-like domain-containing protein [Arhodomonas aquaeolei]|uniref:ferritin-like domain-containing protein n=1 Tax=Arhodomonas aquaeolei TaxID=2369 RepID=UPI00036BB1DD|nr:ferritin family protein [Arhodomonas aquaeolei]
MNKDETYKFDALPAVDSVPALFALATAMEREAACRYDALAARMHAAGNAALARVFADLAEQEREHEHGIAEWGRRQGVDTDSLPGFRWQSPESLSEDAVADAGGEALMTPLRALELAVHNEERAFAFYVRIASEAEEPAVREYAERMADEELGHVALLRLERRRARRRIGPGTRAFADTGALRAYMDSGETTLRGQLAAAVAACRNQGLEGAAARLARLYTDADGEPSASPGSAGTPLSHVDAALRTTEALYAALMSTAEEAKDEALVREAQSRADGIVPRIAILGDVRAGLVRG